MPVTSSRSAVPASFTKCGDERGASRRGRLFVRLAMAWLLLPVAATAETVRTKHKGAASEKHSPTKTVHTPTKATRPASKSAATTKNEGRGVRPGAQTQAKPLPTKSKKAAPAGVEKAIAEKPAIQTATPTPPAPTAVPLPAPRNSADDAGGWLPIPLVSPAKPEVGAVAPSQPSPPAASAPARKPVFATFVHDLWPEAEKRGVSRATFDTAFKGVTLDATTIRLTHVGQSEFVTPVWEYLASSVAPAKISEGRANAIAWKQTLDRIESDFGMPREVVLAVWGIESGYGAMTGNRRTIRVLATLAFIEYRGAMFKDELLQALQILQAGDVAPARMLGSWAGAMGQTQFMPSSFLHYAVDYDGDSRRDIWTDVPDALASTANFLKSEGWDSTMPWGFEVLLPKDFDASHKEQTTLQPMAEWRTRGVKRPAGIAMPETGSASLLIPAGLHGPAFLVTPNFKVIKAYNASTSYALAVALLAEGIAGHPPLSGTWPLHQKPLGVPQARELQKRLKELGYDVGEVDGMVGERVRDAILAFEAKTGIPQEGVAGPALLEKVRATR